MSADNTDPAILDRLELAASSMGIRGRRLEIFTVQDIQPFLAEIDRDAEKGVESFPLWVKVWEASMVLTDHLLGLDLDRNLSVLEVGAGMGISGLFLGACGHPVTLTDFNPDALALLRKNAAHNGLENVRVEKLDWHAPSPGERFDIICGSELIYRETDIQPVMNTLTGYLKPGGTVYLTHDIRRLSMIAFLAEAGKLFDVAHAGKSFTGANKEKIRVVVHTMTLR